MRFLKLSIVVTMALLFLSAPLVAGKGGGRWHSDASSLTEVETEYLLFMREEEKLARDVYITFYEEWGGRIFDNISRSEQSHMDAMKRLLDKYNIDDPVEDETVIDEFVNDDLAAMFEVLIARGTNNGDNSYVDSLKVGAFIEEVDIEDIKNAIDNTDKEDIKSTYESLLCGSGNHLRAFVSQIESLTGEAYEPQWESESYSVEEWAETVATIVTSPMERGCNR